MFRGVVVCFLPMNAGKECIKTLRMSASENTSLRDHFLLNDIYFLPVLNKWPLFAKPGVVIVNNLVKGFVFVYCIKSEKSLISK